MSDEQPPSAAELRARNHAIQNARGWGRTPDGITRISPVIEPISHEEAVRQHNGQPTPPRRR
jgi:hypothetical protein